MSINAITFELDDYTMQIVNGDLLIWIGGLNVDPDVVLRLADLRRILNTADLLVSRAPT
jgi:hypothetical protein